MPREITDRISLVAACLTLTTAERDCGSLNIQTLGKRIYKKLLRTPIGGTEGSER